MAARADHCLFGAHPVLWPVNFVFQIIEFVAKTVSHGMRLFGNMFAGELVFMLIALLGGYATASLGGGLFFIGHHCRYCLDFVSHSVITLQAFIFMMLTLIYLVKRMTRIDRAHPVCSFFFSFLTFVISKESSWKTFWGLVALALVRFVGLGCHRASIGIALMGGKFLKHLLVSLS